MVQYARFWYGRGGGGSHGTASCFIRCTQAGRQAEPPAESGIGNPRRVAERRDGQPGRRSTLRQGSAARASSPLTPSASPPRRQRTALLVRWRPRFAVSFCRSARTPFGSLISWSTYAVCAPPGTRALRLLRGATTAHPHWRTHTHTAAPQQPHTSNAATATSIAHTNTDTTTSRRGRAAQSLEK